MDILLFIVGISGFVASLLFLLVYSIQKESKKKPLMLMGISIVLFTLSLFMNSSDIDTEADKESVEEEKEVETSNNDNEDNDNEVETNTSTDDIQGKDEGTVNIQTDTNVEEVNPEEEKEREEDQKKQEAANEEENEAEKKQREIESDKFNIKTAIKDRIDEGDYTNVTIDSITINENLGTEEDRDYIALVNLDFNVKNTRNTGNKVMRMYSDDLAATLANKGIKNLAEIAIFLKDEYNDRSVKYAYEYKNNGFYIMDIAGE
ncbi:hypothetical protein [Senegalia massiliensis]|uniref:Uncharacterized protein n=1 Tax=Senegalia massiliensis TaxID=1720316 RepID=A0A845R4E0_9CLOT|nr:hypothetical protein [Senegalia massiliensis]NBI08282.1 hypothetical protein [Senegalia massiliensis]